MRKPERSNRPIVGFPACVREYDGLPFHGAGEKYITAVSGGAGCLPLIIPSLGIGGEEGLDLEKLVSSVDGLLITGSPSNVDPREYGGLPSREGTKHDLARDSTSLPLIRAALLAGVPLLAICRGNQELNVALGGTLHQNLQELPGKLDHRADKSLPLEKAYGEAHDVTFETDGVLFPFADMQTMKVNSLHAQGIDRLAPGLAIEAIAPDGVIEAVRVEKGPHSRSDFAIGIQWHPEWRYANSAFSSRLFEAFGDAVRACASARGDRVSAEDLRRESASQQ